MTLALTGYGCVTAHGAGPEPLWNGLWEGRTARTFQPFGPLRIPVCTLPTPAPLLSHEERLSWALGEAWSQSLESGNGVFTVSNRWGVLLASTKGMTEDWVFGPSVIHDSFSPLLSHFVRKTGLQPIRQGVVSHACASTLVALAFGKTWLERQLVDHLLILSCDAVGRFVSSGFHSLQALCPDLARPFDAERSGILLGEAATALVFSRESTHDSVHLSFVDTLTAGGSVTRPSESGEDLITLIRRGHQGAPDAIFTHGTGTTLNDLAEDRALFALYGHLSKVPRATGTKWSVGHTLGASSSIDLIVAAESLKRKALPPLGTTQTIDPRMNYSNYALERKEMDLRRISIQALGFGQTSAVAILESEP